MSLSILTRYVIYKCTYFIIKIDAFINNIFIKIEYEYLKKSYYQMIWYIPYHLAYSVKINIQKCCGKMIF